MMGLSELNARLERDADQRVAAIGARAEAEAAHILAAAERAVENRRAASLEAARRDREGELGRKLALAMKAARTAELRAEHALLERVFGRALALAAELEREPRYLETLPAQLEAALAFLEGGPAQIRCSPALASALRTELEGRSDLTLIEDEKMPLGLIVTTPDGGVKIDQTLPVLLAQIRRAAAVAIVREACR